MGAARTAVLRPPHLYAALVAALALGGCFDSGRCADGACDPGAGSDAGAVLADGECSGKAAGTFANARDPFPDLGLAPARPLRDLAGRVVVAGSVVLRGAQPDELQWLRCLEAIEGSLLIESNPELTDLRGLERLRAVGNMSIRINERLTSLQGLAQDLIDSGDDSVLILDDLTIEMNPALTDAAGLFAHVEASTLRITGTQLSTLPRLGVSTTPATVSLRNNAFVDLAGLRDVTEVGFLHIEEDGLSDLSDLTNLQRVDTLHLRSDGLSDLTGLANLRIVAGDLSIEGAAMTSLRGLDSLRTVGGALALDHLPLLADLSGLEAISAVGGLRIAVLGDLFSSKGPRNLRGLEGLETIHGEVTLDNNHSLQSLQGLDNLTRVTGALHIAANRQLSDLHGLESLRQVGAELAILNNDALTSLQALHPELEVDRLLVLGNPALPQTEADALATRVDRACACDVLTTDEACACARPCNCHQ